MRLKLKRWRPPPVMQPAAGPASGIYKPDFAQRLTLIEGEPVFGIGSCFARNVQAFLAPRFATPAQIAPTAIPDDVAAIHPDLTANGAFWHRYNVFSIRQSLEWALEPDAAGERWLSVQGGQLIDPYASSLPPLPQDAAKRAAHWVDAVLARVRDCRVVIVTLGLSEIWEDQATGRVFNRAPVSELWAAYPSRFRFRVASCAETLTELDALHELLERHGLENHQIVVSVSPIPLLATFGDQDIVVANTASKAILRASVADWASRHANVHYFPSFEMILNADQTNAWMDDGRHCTPAIIAEVMSEFLNQFARIEPPPAAD